MQELAAGAIAEPHPELAEAAPRESVAGREAHVLVLQATEDLADALSIVRIALEVAPVRHDQPLVRGAVDVVHRPADRRQAARDEGLAEALGRDRQVRHRGEATEALAEHAPAVHTELLTDVLGVAHDRIRAEMREVRGLIFGSVARDHGTDRRRPPRSTLIQQQHPVVSEGTLHPASRWTRGSGRLESRAALEVEQVWAVATVRRGDLAGEDRDPRPIRTAVIERHVVLALRERRTWYAIRDRAPAASGTFFVRHDDLVDESLELSVGELAARLGLDPLARHAQRPRLSGPESLRAGGRPRSRRRGSCRERSPPTCRGPSSSPWWRGSHPSLMPRDRA